MDTINNRETQKSPTLDLSRLALSCDLLDTHIRRIFQATDDINSNDEKTSPASSINVSSSSQIICHNADEGFIRSITRIDISHNTIGNYIPSALVDHFGLFESKLISLDLSDNGIEMLDPRIVMLKSLMQLNVSNNLLTEKSFPAEFSSSFSCNLKSLILSGNRLTKIPNQLFELSKLECLYLGGNKLRYVPNEIAQLANLKTLYLGGNQLRHISNQIGNLSNLEALALCDNQLESLPTSISRLVNLRSLALHNNNLKTLPQDIVELDSLIELSLRNNPLVVRFVQDIAKTRLLTLLELSARAVKANNIVYTKYVSKYADPGPSGQTIESSADHDLSLPKVLVEYLNSACKCVNPKCKGVYFESKVEHVRFVDFCGAYRLPLLQYLCSQECTDYRQPDVHDDDFD